MWGSDAVWLSGSVASGADGQVLCRHQSSVKPVTMNTSRDSRPNEQTAACPLVTSFRGKTWNNVRSSQFWISGAVSVTEHAFSLGLTSMRHSECTDIR